MANDAASGLAGAPPPPPRMTGDPGNDMVAMNTWAWDFYRSVVIQNYYLQEAGQFDPGDFDPSTLPDPATATIATAQSTANEAYALASNAKDLADQAQVDADTAMDRITATGEVVISDTNSTATITFTTAQPNTSYSVFVQAVDYAGGPSIDAFHVVKKTKTVNSFTFTIFQAPGAGKSVTFEFFVMRRT